MRHPNFNIDTFIEYTEGTCNSMQEALDSVYDGIMFTEDLTSDDLEEIDSRIFQCDDCGWWMDRAMMGEEACIECEGLQC